MRVLIGWFASIVLGCGATPLLHAQTVCRAPDAASMFFKDEITRYATARFEGDAEVRDSIRLPAVAASKVVWVTSESVCKKVRTAYQNRLVNTGGSAFSGRLYVLKVGTTRYVATDPEFYYGPQRAGLPPHRVIVIMDTQYRPLSLF